MGEEGEVFGTFNVDGLTFKEFVLSTYTTLGIKSKLFLLSLNRFFGKSLA